MREIRSRIETIRGMPVVTAPAEIDVTTAGQLRAALLDAASDEHTTVVVDMTRTRFCDSAGLTVLVRAHRRALAGPRTTIARQLLARGGARIS